MIEDIENYKWLLDYASYVTWPFATVIIFWLSAKAGILGGITSLMKGITDNMRITKLENFREEAETNHFHDLENMQDRMSKVEDKLDRVAEDVAYIKGKINNK